MRQSISDKQKRKKTEPLIILELELFKEFKPNYLVSNLGRVYVKEHYGTNGHFIRGKFLKLTKLNTGYPCIAYEKNKYTIHRIVAELFVENTNGLSHVNHKDRNRANNHYKNLEWCTPLENNHHAINTGLCDNRGEKHGLSRFTNEEIIKIKSLRKTMKQKDGRPALRRYRDSVQ